MVKKGFSLSEILILAAIIIIVLSAAVVALDPKEIFEKSRDKKRYSDITTLATAVNLYLADGKVFDAKVLEEGMEYKSTDLVGSAAGSSDGAGWVKIDFAKITSGAPLDKLPLDPRNNEKFHYSIGFLPDTNTYEIDCSFENLTNSPKAAIDGGNNSNRYEVGTNLEILE